MNNMRLDKVCAIQIGSRTKAQDHIKKGLVEVNGKVIQKSSFLVTEQDSIVIKNDGYEFVSRAAYKLLGAMDTFHIDISHQVVLDIGASTVGFTDVCLRHDAKKVYALDVGHLQLSPKLETDPRVIKMEGKNARELEVSWFDEPIDFICMDVSFISCQTILEHVFTQMIPSHLVVLVKPQFECGPQALNKHGVLKNEKLAKQIIAQKEAFLKMYYKNVDVMKSPIQGRSGNQEYVVYAQERRSK